MAMAASLGTGFLRTDNALDTPDIQYHIQPLALIGLKTDLINSPLSQPQFVS